MNLDFSLPEPHIFGKQLSLWATFYYVYSASITQDGFDILDGNGIPTGDKLSKKDWCHAALEGTVRVSRPDGSAAIYNFHSRGTTKKVDCSSFFKSLSHSTIENMSRTRFMKSSGEFGHGVKNMHLVPYRSIAVDRNHVSFKSVIYIPEARGRKIILPDGSETNHDGYFFAADTGGAIKGNHIDIFYGTFSKNAFPNFVRSSSEHTFKAFHIDDNSIFTFLSDLHSEKGG